VIDLRIPAISYAGLGWPVFPCKPGDKVPATRRGFKDATTDLDLVDRMWSGHRRRNIGTPTGVVWDVLDFDRKPPTGQHPGVDATGLWQRLAHDGWLDGCAGIAETRNGGRHYYFPTSGARSGSIPLLGVDFKAAGGYVLLAPSKVPADLDDGPGRYRWIRFPDPTVPGVPLDWAKLRAHLVPDADPHQGRHQPRQSTSGGSLDGLARAVRDAQPGNRNHVLYWAGCRAAEAGTLHTAAPMLLAAAQAAGLTTFEAERTLASAARTVGGAR
jgi:hypothetical protein